MMFNIKVFAMQKNRQTHNCVCAPASMLVYVWVCNSGGILLTVNPQHTRDRRCLHVGDVVSGGAGNGGIVVLWCWSEGARALYDVTTLISTPGVADPGVDPYSRAGQGQRVRVCRVTFIHWWIGQVGA